MSETLNIYQKLARIRKQVEVMQRSKSGFGYKYVPEDAILAKVSVFMDRYHLSLIPGIVPATTIVSPYSYRKTKNLKDGTIIEENVNEILVTADTTWTWVDDDDPESRIEVPWALVGQQADASQAFGSGLTYSGRYFLLKYFNIATPNDDPDAFRSKQKQAAAEEQQMVLEEIMAELDSAIRGFLAANPDRKDEVKKFCAKYAKDGSYRLIKEPAVAGGMLNDFREAFLNEQKEEK